MKRNGLRLGLLVGVVLVASLYPHLAGAQTAATGALAGVVTDPTGAVIPNVTVTATSVDTGQVRTGATGADGSYTFSLLPPGTYRVKFAASGFQTVEAPAVTVTVTETGTLNYQLTVGTQSQQVEVQANVEAVQTESSTVGTVVGSQAATELPLSTRNYTNLITLTAGANASVQNSSSIGKGGQNIATNGSSVTQNNWQMDGVSIVNYGSQNELVTAGVFGTIGIPSPDALQEFKIQTSTFDASYGRNTGASVNVVTKSGTNDFHGTAFEFNRNTVFNANDFFLKSSQLASGEPNTQAVLSQNQYGGVIGGPIKKDKVFFFLSNQETWQKNGLDISGYSAGINLPPLPPGDRSTPAWKAALGAAICPQNNSNSESLANSQGGITRANYAAQEALGVAQVKCDGSNINPVAINILNLKLLPGLGQNGDPGGYYIPTSGTSSYRSVAYSEPAHYLEYQGNANGDIVINSKNTFAVRYFYSRTPATSPFALPLSSGGSHWLPGTPENYSYNNHTAVLKLTTIVTNNLVNEARVSYQREDNQLHTVSTYTNTQVGETPNCAAGFCYDKLTGTNIAGLFEFGVNSAADEAADVNSYQAADQISWTHGKHTIRAGFEADHDWWQYSFKGLPGTGVMAMGVPSFADFLLGLPGCSPALTSAQCLASGLAGTTTGTSFSFQSSVSNSARTYDSTNPPPGPGNHHNIVAHADTAFFQDDLKVLPRLTFNLGLRWEYDSFISDQNGHSTGIWASLINTQPIPGTGCVYNNFAWGAGATGTGCSFAGFEAPSNYDFGLLGPLPAGVYLSNSPTFVPNSPPWDNFAPRLGFAWQPLASSKFVVRGGAGYYYNRTEGSAQTYFGQIQPYAVSLQCSAATCFQATLANPLLNTPLGWTPRWANPATGVSSNYTPGGGSGVPAPGFTNPVVYQYGLNIQYEFLPTWILELGYAGSQGIHEPITNFTDGGLLASASNPLYCGYDGVATHCVTTDTTANASARVPYLGFAPAFHQLTSNGGLKYDSLEATVRKQFSHGLTFQSAYTWSRALVSAQIGNPNASFTDNVPVIMQYGLNSAYHPQRFVTSYNYELPFGHPSGLLDKIVSGWVTSGVITIQDGTPLTITAAGGTAFGTPVGSNAEFAPGMGNANVGTSGSLFEKVANGLIANGVGYLNRAAFVATPSAATLTGCSACTGTLYGNSGQGVILGPGQNNWDLSLFKTTKVGGLREDATLQFRAEFFNSFNHPQFNNPSTNFSATSSFGSITQASVNPRLLQFALKYAF